MGRRKADTTPAERQLIVKWHEEGKSYREISELIGRSKSTIQYILKKIKISGTTDSQHGNAGRRKILTPREEAMLIREVKKNPFTSGPHLAQCVNDKFNKCVSVETCRRVVRNHGFHGRVARKKPYISKVNRLKRLAFAREYVNKDSSFWKHVIFSDESKFNVFGSDGRKFVWRRVNRELEMKNLKSTVKHGGGSVMIWGCMARNGVGNLVFIDGTMDKMVYLNILKNNLKSSASKLGLENTFYFQQDNDPKHTAHIVQQFIILNVPHRLQTPPQSPDVNPIEHLWAEIEKRLQRPQITSVKTLKERILQVWTSIEPQITEKLVDSMPNRLKAIIRAKGGPTKY